MVKITSFEPVSARIVAQIEQACGMRLELYTQYDYLRKQWTSFLHTKRGGLVGEASITMKEVVWDEFSEVNEVCASIGRWFYARSRLIAGWSRGIYAIS